MLFLVWLVVALPGLSRAAAVVYTNDAIVQCPPQIAPQIVATNFVNVSYFSINSNFEPYETTETVNYTNVGQMLSGVGFRFETSPAGAGVRRRAGTLFNNGTIDCGSKLLASATNILHSGVIDMGYESLLSLKGHKIDLNRGTVNSETSGFASVFNGTNFFTVFSSGIFDGYWNVGEANGSNVAYLFPNSFNNIPASTPFHLVTNRDYSVSIVTLFGDNQVAYVDDVQTAPSNRVVNAVFLHNSSPAYSVNVYFPFPGDTWVEWLTAVTNSAGQLVTNYIYLHDTFGVFTNLQLAVNGSGGGIYHPTFKPVNYTFFQNGPRSLGAPAVPGLPPNTFVGSTVVTNPYSAYHAQFEVTSRLLTDVAGQNPTNLPGRVEIRGEGTLNLSRAHIDALNYLLLEATNHFVSSSRAQISTPWSDMNLRSTNGSLAITNLIYPTITRPEGDIFLWSGRWTNVVNDITNSYHVLFVDHDLNPTAPAQIQNLTLRCTNVAGGGGNILVSDVLNVNSNLLLETESLTLLTNGPGALAQRGEILIGGLGFLGDSEILWPTSTPRLAYLTNNGVIRSGNAVFFGGARFEPYYATNYNEPYAAMVNRGEIYNQGSLIWADYFENSGLISVGLGSISLQSTNALLFNGSFPAPNGNVTVNSGHLIISNHVLQAGRTLTLNPTSFLDDGSLANSATAATNVATKFEDPTSAVLFTSVAAITNKNIWSAGDGINLLTCPPQASLLGTTISATAALRPRQEVISQWAARDLGCSPVGFSNNAALGRLILDGVEYDSLFTFTGTGAANALYVDYLELRNFATNRDAMGNFIGINVDSNMKIYFGQAVANGASIAEKLDGKNDGRFCWVVGYAGYYSSTNMVYPDGTTNTFNAALVGSCNLDSDGDGFVNCSDPTPILRPGDIALAVSVVNQPTPKAEVSWQSGPYAANHVYYKDSFGATNWLLLTNFVSSPLGGRVSVLDPIKPTGPRYYRVRVDVNQP